MLVKQCPWQGLLLVCIHSGALGCVYCIQPLSGECGLLVRVYDSNLRGPR